MFHSYVMGIDKSILDLSQEGFIIQNDGDNFTISFPENKVTVWENFIKKHLEVEYWNEYLTDDKVVFLFHLQDGFKRFEVENFHNEEVLKLCDEFNTHFSDNKTSQYEFHILNGANELKRFLKNKYQNCDNFDEKRLDDICSSNLFVGKLLNDFIKNLFD